MAAGFAGLRSTAQKCWGGSWIRGPEVTGWLAAGCGLVLRSGLESRGPGSRLSWAGSQICWPELVHVDGAGLRAEEMREKRKIEGKEGKENKINPNKYYELIL